MIASPSLPSKPLLVLRSPIYYPFSSAHSCSTQASLERVTPELSIFQLFELKIYRFCLLQPLNDYFLRSLPSTTYLKNASQVLSSPAPPLFWYSYRHPTMWLCFRVLMLLRSRSLQISAHPAFSPGDILLWILFWI